MIEGDYDMDVYVNDDGKGRYKIKFIQNMGVQDINAKIVPCFGQAQILSFGVDEKKIDLKLEEGECVQLQQWFKGASFHIDVQKLELRLSIPSAYFNAELYSIKDIQKWDAGIDALFFNYNFFYVTNQFKNNSHLNMFNNQSIHANFKLGLNLSKWQLRHEAKIDSRGHFNRSLDHFAYESSLTYLQRYIPAYRSVFKAGELWTESSLFDPVVFYGLSFNSDDRMLSTIATNYAPTLYGIAKTNARIEVRNQNQLIYQAMVAAGAFEINQLSVLGTQGELELSIIESDGEVKKIRYPYVSSPYLLRPGMDRYRLYMGQYRSMQAFQQQSSEFQNFFQFEYARGLNNYLSSGIGLHYAQCYLNSQLSLVLASPMGVWNGGIEWGYRDLNFERRQYERKLKLSYHYFFQQSQSAMQFSLRLFQQPKSEPLMRSENLRRLVNRRRLEDNNRIEDINQLKQSSQVEDGNQVENTPITRLVELRPDQTNRQRLDAQFSFYQKLPQAWGNLSFAASYSQDTMFRMRRYGFNFGYQQHYKWLSYSFNLYSSFSSDGYERVAHELNYMLSMTMPLQGLTRSTRLNMDLQGQSHRSAINMDVTENIDFGLSLLNTTGSGTSYSLSSRIRQPEYLLNLGYGSSKRDRQYAVNLSGSFIAHRQGVLWSADQGTTMALIYAANATGAKINNALGARINRKGYALVPYLSPYKYNDVSLDPSDIPNSVELEYSRLRVIPYADAILSLNFPTRIGYVLFIQAKLNNGTALPFYASIYNQNDKLIGHVAQGGMVYIRTAQLKGRVKIFLDQNRQASCELDYDVSHHKEIHKVGYAMLEGVCISSQP